MTIGERLEEARKRKGISIREVSEATKIRGDFLMAMEDNSMEIPLPEIYKRGFLKNYAKYLKLDPDKLLTDYVAQQKGRAAQHRERSVAGEDRPVFGRMEIEEEEPASAPVPPESGRPAARDEEPSDEASRQEPPPRPAPILTDNTLYLKIAAGLMGTALVVLLVIVLVNLLRSGDEVPVNAGTGPANTAAVEETAGTGAAVTEAARSPTITLRANEDVTVIVDDVVTRERLFRGILRAGETQLIEREGAVNIKFSDGGALVIETGGETVRPSTTGMGQIQI